jgi:predicted dehydrogenase
LIRAKFSFTLEDKNNIRLKKSLGGGSLWDVGCYPVSFAQAINEADPVEVFGWQKLNTKGTEIIFAGQLKFANGVIAQIDSGFAMPFRIGAEVIGENGVIVVSNPWLPDLDNKSSGLVHITPDDAEIPIPTEVKNPYLCEVEVIERAVLDGVPTPYTLTESRGNVATITALYKSAEQGEVVRVNED